MKNTTVSLSASHEEQGSFDYFSHQICINRYTQAHQAWIEDCLNDHSNFCGQEGINARDLKSLFVHEVTHFLDLTTTLWGLEYTARKSSLLDKIHLGEDHGQALDVFMLNTSELEMHKALLVRNGESLAGCTMNHAIMIHPDYGPIIVVIYYRDGVECHKIPLSMLALFEAHATANEVLSKIRDIDQIADENERIVAHSHVNQEFNEHLHDPALTEYTLLLNLAKLHFPELSLRELLVFFSAVARFTMNQDALSLSILSDRMRFLPTEAGYALSLDMKRGASRAVVAFKTLLFMHEWIRMGTSMENAKKISMLKTKPSKAIRQLWEDDNVKFIDATFQIERNCYLTSLKERQHDLPDFEIVSTSITANTALLESSPVGLLSLSDLTLMDAILNEDCTPIAMPKRLDIDVESYFDQFYPLMAKLKKLYQAKKASKFFINPDDTILFVNL